MKAKMKALIVVLCVVSVVAISVLGTLAYLTSRDEVINTFTIGDVSINLDEAAVDTDGNPIDGADRVKQNEYHLLPGKTYVKDPTVTVAKESDEAYIRMMVTVNYITELKAIFGDDFRPENYVSGWDSAKWPCVAAVDNGDNTATYEFRYYKTVSTMGADADLTLEPLFTSLNVPGTITSAQLKTIADLQITVEGHAIQRVGLDTADAAWAAFDAQMGNA